MRQLNDLRESLAPWKIETSISGGTPGVLYRCANNGVARRGICKLMKTMGIKIDGCAWVERSLRVNERRTCGHGCRPWILVYHTGTGSVKEIRSKVASTDLCKLEEGFSFPGTVEMTDDAVDDAVAALQVGEAGNGPGAAAHFAEGALDDIGGAHLDPVGLRHGEKV